MRLSKPIWEFLGLIQTKLLHAKNRTVELLVTIAARSTGKWQAEMAQLCVAGDVSQFGATRIAAAV